MQQMPDAINRAQIRALMGFHNESKTSLSKKIGVVRETLTAFLDGGLPSYKLMQGLQKHLCMSPDEATAIFFGEDLRKT